jgi:hypothetical protein
VGLLRRGEDSDGAALPLGARDAFRAALRDVVSPVLRTEGFKGSGSTWRLASERGDYAIVNVQSSSGSSAREVLFVINLAVVVAPRWAHALSSATVPRSKVPKEYDGLWRDRLRPSPGVAARRGGEWWSVADALSAREAAEDVVAQLRDGALAKLRWLLDRGNMVSTIRDQDLGFFRGSHHSVYFHSALAYVLADDGPSEELSELLDHVLLDDVEARDDLRRRAETRATWIREWAASRGSEADKARPASAVIPVVGGGTVARTTLVWKWEDDGPEGEGVGPVWIDSLDADPDKPERSQPWDQWVRRSEAQAFAQEHGYEFFADE